MVASRFPTLSLLHKKYLIDDKTVLYIQCNGELLAFPSGYRGVIMGLNYIMCGTALSDPSVSFMMQTVKSKFYRLMMMLSFSPFVDCSYYISLVIFDRA